MSNYDQYIRAVVFDFLVKAARQKRTITYETIALEFGLPSKGSQLGTVLSPILGDIYRFCEQRKMPPLTVLVIRKSGESMGLPGKGFWDLYLTSIKSFKLDNLVYDRQSMGFGTAEHQMLLEATLPLDAVGDLKTTSADRMLRAVARILTDALQKVVYDYWSFPIIGDRTDE